MRKAIAVIVTSFGIASAGSTFPPPRAMAAEPAGNAVASPSPDAPAPDAAPSPAASPFPDAPPPAADAGAPAAPASFTIRADWFSRGNVRASLPGTEYADRYPCIWNAGRVPNEAEYDLDFPVTADYEIAVLYTAQDSRPVDIHLDGVRVHRGLASVTGSWQTSGARWEPQVRVRIARGPHVLKLLCPGPCMPHICAIRFESSEPFPEGWRLDRRIDGLRDSPAPAASAAPAAPTAAVKPHTPPAHRLLTLAILGDERTLEAAVLSRAEALAAGPAARDELLRVTPDGDVPSTPWVARLALRRPDGSVETGVLELSAGRVRRMLLHGLDLVDDYRAMDRVPPDYLEAERAELSRRLAALDRRGAGSEDGSGIWDAYLATFRLEVRVVLANPLLDFDRLLVVARRAGSPSLGLPQNWQSNCALPAAGFDDEIALLSPLDPRGELKTLHRPERPAFVGDVDLHFDAGKLLFSSVDSHGRWQVFEVSTDGTGLRQVTPPDQPDVHCYDACYLPDGRIIFSSTASMAAVPCVNGSTLVANLYRMEPDGTGIRQLCFDQEHDWCPTVLPDGRVLYLRWEYTDTPHSHDRVLFHMNPDGTGQKELSGSNSYWPNSMFYARPIPGRPTRFVAIVGGHHGVPRMGELVIFDVGRGRREADGVVQRIPGRGAKVAPVIADNLVDASWPKFLHPFPLGEAYFLVAAQQTPGSLWGIYLVDAFDGMFLVREEPGRALLEPVPLRKTRAPPAIPDGVDLARKDGTVYMIDVGRGGGLAGIPRGAVKALRLVSYHFLFPGMGGPQGVVGMEGPWDIKRILGTVPVEEDGSAFFRVPANTPISVQPLDAEGKALQLMRSWFTVMPGEVLSCVGCHEPQNTGPPNVRTLALARAPSEVAPWRGPARGFSFAREVQPVLDARCVRCHDGQRHPELVPGLLPDLQAGPDSDLRPDLHADLVPGLLPDMLPDLRGLETIEDYTSVYHHGGVDAGRFTVSYATLHRYVRRPGLESDYHMLAPMEFHADTTELVRMLRKGHGGATLDEEDWDRIVTWIDLNAPFHGTWTEIAGEARVKDLARRRRELSVLYGGPDVDPEEIPARAVRPATAEPAAKAAMQAGCAIEAGSAMDASAEVPANAATPRTAWPFDAAEAARRQAALGPSRRTVDLGGGVLLELVRIPAGELILGDAASGEGMSGSGGGPDDEGPRTRVRIERPFWMGRTEVTNAQYARFDPLHDSRVESRHAMQFGVRGFFVDGPRQPVVRVSWHDAMAFCAWLGSTTGERFTLPTEAQWEYACRAGTETAFWYGERSADFSRYANLADRKLREFVCDPYDKARSPFPDPSGYDDWIPKDERFDDGGFVSEDVGRYEPNAWGLADMHGNVAEWTLSAYRPYPYRPDDGRNDPGTGEPRVVRGGSWRDRPGWARSGARLSYRPYQPVFDVGFRVVCAAE